MLHIHCSFSFRGPQVRLVIHCSFSFDTFKINNKVECTTDVNISPLGSNQQLYIQLHLIIIIIIIIINSLFKEGNSVIKEMLVSPEAL
jgi:hypothetical protein